MIVAEALKQTITVCMFDQYGTVVDMQGGLVEAATPYLKAKGWTGNPNSFVTWWRRTHFENSMIDALLQKEHTSYREIGERAVDFVLDRAGIEHTMDEVRGLVAHIEQLRPFPEVPAALERLRARYRLGIISNTDDDLIAGTVAAIGVPIEFVVTAEQAGAYKPDHRLFLHAHAVMGVTREETIHVGMGQFTDMKVCHELGIRSVWIDRAGEAAAEWPADTVLRDLSGLPGLLLAS